MPVTIRFATVDDIPAFVEAGRQIHATTRFSVYDYNAEKLSKALRAIIEDTRGSSCFIAALDAAGRPLGWIIGTMERQFYSDLPVASVIHFGVVPGRRMSGAGLRLLMAFRQWAENRGAFELNAGVSSGVDIERMDRFLKRLGFRLTGGNYALMLRLDLSAAVG